ncbi:biotin/lipoyl-binding protein [Sinimarinibacterium sp. NLF-5-8]|uniref:biotin/lipoyl-binding protein n=1 Tax=Sinimarinibacterium sp. NLF-5-8 TaxID=2698684 RepID=UPI00192E8A4C|nr:biotin/lipoyl-binding protein [Sinimarinibacterium sp. NLF-5-8]
MSHKPDSAPATDPRPIEQRAFENLGRAVGLGAYGGRGVNAVFKPLFSSLEVNRQDWGADAHHALALQKLPRARALLYAVAVIVLLLLVWAGLAPIDEVTRGEGKVIPSRQLQVVQSVDGGVVEALFVKEGQKVAQGDLLVRIDPTRFVANYEEGTARAFALRAKADRLTALVDQKPYKPELGTDLNPAQQRVLEQQQRFYQTSKAELAERIAIAREQLTQRQKELNEAEARLAQASRNHGMAAQELAVTKPLLASGAASEVEILRLERDVSQASGEVEQARARMAQIEAGVTEAQGRIRETGLAMRNQWRAELAETLGELNSLGEKRQRSGRSGQVRGDSFAGAWHGTAPAVQHSGRGGTAGQRGGGDRAG